MAESPPPSPAQGFLSIAGLALTLGAAVLLLYASTTATQRWPCAALLLPIALVAWPIWWYRTDRVLLERRAVLAAVALPGSRLQRWFWGGRVTAVIQAFAALFLAALLLGFTTTLQTAHWVVLAADAVLLTLLFRPIKRWFTRGIRQEHQGFVARHWPLMAINVLLLVAAIVWLEYAILERPDTRGMPWHDVAAQAFHAAQSRAACPAAGALMGLGNAIEATTWHAAMSLIPELPERILKVLAWMLFLAWTAFGVFLFTRFLLGVLTLVDRVSGIESDRSEVGRWSRAFLWTVLALAPLHLFIANRLAGVTLPPLASLRTEAAKSHDPCVEFAPAARLLHAQIDSDVTRARQDAESFVDARIDALLDTAFASAERGVDAYLDWYFSLLGDYTRLGALVSGDFDRLMRDQLAQHVIADPRLQRILSAGSVEIEIATAWRMAAAAESAGVLIQDFASESHCPVLRIDIQPLGDLRLDRLRAAVATTLGVATGTLTFRYLMRRPIASVSGKLAARRTIRTGAQVLAKAAARRGGAAVAAAASGTAVCSPSGLWAVFCGAAAGIAAWFATDKAAIEIEEALFRDEMRADLLASLAEELARIERELKALHRRQTEAYATQIQLTTAKVFNPARDGV